MDLLLALQQRGKLQESSFEQVLVVLVNHGHPVLLTLLGDAQTVYHAAYMMVYLYTLMNWRLVCF